jgi:hypothetical protein
LKKIVSYLLTFLCIIPLITLTSCKNYNKPLSINRIETIIQRRYDTKVYFLSDNTDDDHKGNIWFKDKSGFKFKIECDYTVCDWDFLNRKTYTAYEYYIPAYYNAHPELFEIFSEDGHRFEINEKGEHILYFNSYYELDELAEFACNCADKISITNHRITAKSAHGLWDRDFNLYFEPADIGYEWNGFMRMTIPNNFYTPETLAEHLKEYYVHQLIWNNDKEHLAEVPNDIIKKYS